MRDYLQRHLEQNTAPSIGLLETPVGGLDRLRGHLGDNGINVEELSQSVAAAAAEDDAF